MSGKGDEKSGLPQKKYPPEKHIANHTVVCFLLSFPCTILSENVFQGQALSKRVSMRRVQKRTGAALYFLNSRHLQVGLSKESVLGNPLASPSQW